MRTDKFEIWTDYKNLTYFIEIELLASKMAIGASRL